ncbi:PREDICTED: acyl-coenzyme A amino acid N-acyltransferase 1-like [Priapulus caudatus]|uniref:Acyl-coenzyme A amino acid N-acyltransferase 1-like n=1 Tax=Priapulus caudatus TaxID=37621 RepID=A0ABM1E142_PRICU|nr:PREDICTED: acyl-coenzyme A amino acid N-acyltransferase 1-like [Priapulus caudatus]XP_014665914.1 PREDICTED: acyl-coenzyme A amino acid N-acyltransferase 1-like [Priapulus caudatus]
MVTIQAIPRKALVDEVVKIIVNQLRPGQPVTIEAQLQEDKKVFYSYAHFKADQTGVVDLDVHPSIGGSYTDVMPMGLFCSLLPVPGQLKGMRLLKKDVATPMTFDLRVYDGLHHIADTHHVASLLANTTLERWYKADGVVVQEVEHGNIRGRLFLPQGPGPFPGIIDMFGSVGGIVTFRSALLASRGFAALALPYMGYKGLPTDFAIPLEYFQEAVDWFSSHPQVLPYGVGAMGVSLGGEIALCMASYMENKHKVKAVVSINGNTVHGAFIRNKGEYFLNTKTEGYKVVEYDEGISLTDVNSEVPQDSLIQVENADAPIMFVTSGDDRCVSEKEAHASADRMSQHGKHNYEVCLYPGAGHLVEPPYSPLCNASYHAAMGELQRYMKVNIQWCDFSMYARNSLSQYSNL